MSSCRLRYRPQCVAGKAALVRVLWTARRRTGSRSALRWSGRSGRSWISRRRCAGWWAAVARAIPAGCVEDGVAPARHRSSGCFGLVRPASRARRGTARATPAFSGANGVSAALRLPIAARRQPARARASATVSVRRPRPARSAVQARLGPGVRPTRRAAAGESPRSSAGPGQQWLLERSRQSGTNSVDHGNWTAAAGQWRSAAERRAASGSPAADERERGLPRRTARALRAGRAASSRSGRQSTWTVLPSSAWSRSCNSGSGDPPARPASTKAARTSPRSSGSLPGRAEQQTVGHRPPVLVPLPASDAPSRSRAQARVRIRHGLPERGIGRYRASYGARAVWARAPGHDRSGRRAVEQHVRSRLPGRRDCYRSRPCPAG